MTSRNIVSRRRGRITSGDTGLSPAAAIGSRDSTRQRRGLPARGRRSLRPGRGRQPIPGLERILNMLPPQLVTRWTVASWLVSPDADLDGARPIDVLARGGPDGADRVVAAASSWSAALAA